MHPASGYDGEAMTQMQIWANTAMNIYMQMNKINRIMMGRPCNDAAMQGRRVRRKPCKEGFWTGWTGRIKLHCINNDCEQDKNTVAMKVKYIVTPP